MDESWRNLALILGAGGYGAVVGSVFGAVTGAVHWGSGRAAGTAIAHRVAVAFEKAGDRELSRQTRGAIIGALDGFLFLGRIPPIKFIPEVSVRGIAPKGVGAVKFGPGGCCQDPFQGTLDFRQGGGDGYSFQDPTGL